MSATGPTIRSRHGVAALAGHLATPEGIAGEAVNAGGSPGALLGGSP